MVVYISNPRIQATKTGEWPVSLSCQPGLQDPVSKKNIGVTWKIRIFFILPLCHMASFSIAIKDKTINQAMQF